MFQFDKAKPSSKLSKVLSKAEIIERIRLAKMMIFIADVGVCVYSRLVA